MPADIYCAKCKRETPTREAIQVLPGSGAKMRVLRCVHCSIAKDAHHGTAVRFLEARHETKRERDPSMLSPEADTAVAFVRKLRATGRFTMSLPPKRRGPTR